MSLVRRISLGRSAAWGAALAVTGVLGLVAPPAFAIGGVVVTGLITWRVGDRMPLWIVRREYTRLHRKIEARDHAGAEASLAELRRLYQRTPGVREQLVLQEAIIRASQGRHGEAVALIDSVDVRQLDERWRFWRLNNLAWSLAELGEGARAVALARQSLDEKEVAGVSGDDFRAYQLGTLGASLVAAGEAREAIPYLEQALARGGRPYIQAARAFFLGEALHALGKEDAAVAAWRRAAETAPGEDHGKRAAERLAARNPYRG